MYIKFSTAIKFKCGAFKCAETTVWPLSTFYFVFRVMVKFVRIGFKLFGFLLLLIIVKFDRILFIFGSSCKIGRLDFMILNISEFRGLCVDTYVITGSSVFFFFFFFFFFFCESCLNIVLSRFIALSIPMLVIFSWYFCLTKTTSIPSFELLAPVLLELLFLIFVPDCRVC